MHERQYLKEQTALSFKIINPTIKPPRPRIKTIENFRPESIPIYIWFSDEIFSDAIRVFHKLRAFVFSFYICTTSHVMYFMLGEMFPLRHPSNKCGINVETQLFIVFIVFITIGGSKGAPVIRPLRSKFFQFHAVFWKNWLNNSFSHPPLELAPVKSWIRHWSPCISCKVTLHRVTLHWLNCTSLLKFY